MSKQHLDALMTVPVLDSYSADKLAENLLKQFVFYEPTPKQKAFHDAGLHAGERLFLGGNRTGKTNAVCMEMAMHLTGTYPAWWQGYRFRRPINAISASISSPEGGLSAEPPRRLDDYGSRHRTRAVFGVAGFLFKGIAWGSRRGHNNGYEYFRDLPQGRL